MKTRMKPCQEYWDAICEQLGLAYIQLKLVMGKDAQITVVATEPYAEIFHRMLGADLEKRGKSEMFIGFSLGKLRPTDEKEIYHVYPAELFPVQCGMVIVAVHKVKKDMAHIFYMNSSVDEIFDFISGMTFRTENVRN